jgi:hypothetical protein
MITVDIRPYGTSHPIAVEFKGSANVSIAIAVQVHALTQQSCRETAEYRGERLGQSIHQGHVLFIGGMPLEQGF